MKIHRSPRPAFGLSLIEIMIALAIGTVLLLGLVEVFGASRTAYQLSTGLARVQENGRFAMDFLQRDLRMTGHFGCVNDQARFLPENITATRPALASTFLTDADQIAGAYQNVGKEWLRFDVGIQGYDAKIGGGGAATNSGSTITLAATPTLAGAASAWQPALSTDLFGAINDGTGRPVQNSDVLVLRYFYPTGAPMTGFTPGDPATLTFNNANSLKQGIDSPGLFAISDCINAAVFEATTATLPATGGGTIMVRKNNGANKSGLLGNQNFVTGQATLYRAESAVYYVGINATGNPALYRIRYNLPPGTPVPTGQTPGGPGGNYTKEELVEGIESLQLQYAQDSRTAVTDRPTGNMGTSVIASAVVPAADPVTAWRRVGLVQIGLVARSPDRASAQQRDTSVAGVTALSALGVQVTPPDDARFRTVYEDSVALRNRLFGN